MKLPISKFILKAILISGFFGSILSVILLGIVGLIENQSRNSEDHQRLDCFPGLGIAILISFQIFYMMSSCSAFINIFLKIRSSFFNSFLSFFALNFIIFVLLFTSLGFESSDNLNFIILSFILFHIPWVMYFLKFQRMFK